MSAELPALSVVVPVHDERDNIDPLIDEIVAALRGRWGFEIVYVDDLSRDDTLERLRAAKARVPELRIVRHLSQSGQSTAVRNGVKAARGACSALSRADCSSARSTSAPRSSSESSWSREPTTWPRASSSVWSKSSTLKGSGVPTASRCLTVVRAVWCIGLFRPCGRP